MDSNTDTSKPTQNKITILSWFMASPTRIVGLIFLLIALILMLTLLVFISQKSIKTKGKVIPQPTPGTAQNNFFPFPTTLPDPTLNWTKVSSLPDLSLKIPSETTSAAKVSEKLSFLEIIASSSGKINKPSLIIEVFDHSDTVFKTNPTKQYVDFIYEENTISSAKTKMITKPIEILIGGLKGYEYYIEGSQFIGFGEDYQVNFGKYRIIQFDKNSKAFLIFSSLDTQSQQVLNTLTFK